MAATSALYARIDAELKEHAETILSQLGITPASAIQMFYSQVILQRGLPFTPRLTPVKPRALGAMDREELDAELAKGFDSLRSGRTYSAQEVDEELRGEFGI